MRVNYYKNSEEYLGARENYNKSSSFIENNSANVSSMLYELFIQNNGRLNTTGKKNAKDHIDKIIENTPLWVNKKLEFTLEYVTKHNLLKPDKIKSLKLSNLIKQDETYENKVESIINDIENSLSEENRNKLTQYVSMSLINVSKWVELSDKSRDWESEKKAYEDTIEALVSSTDLVNEAGKRFWSRNNRIARMVTAIEKSNIESWRKALLVIAQLTSNVAWWKNWPNFKKLEEKAKNMNVIAEILKASERISNEAREARKTNDKNQQKALYVQINALANAEKIFSRNISSVLESSLNNSLGIVTDAMRK